MQLELEGKKVFITASTDGIGKATALCFLEEGANVIINGRNKEKLEKRITELRNQFGIDRVDGIVGDMSKREDIQRAKNYIVDKLGLLDILIGNLGTGKPVCENKWNIEEWNYMLQMNLLSAINLVDGFKECIVEQKASSMVFITSLAAFDKIGAPPAYAAAKSGVVSMIKYLSDEMAAKKIRVNGVSPGNIYYEGGRWEELEKLDPQGTEKYIEEKVPMKRFGKIEEVAMAIVFLASNKSSFTTGAILKIDGGQSRGY